MSDVTGSELLSALLGSSAKDEGPEESSLGYRYYVSSRGRVTRKRAMTGQFVQAYDPDRVVYGFTKVLGHYVTGPIVSPNLGREIGVNYLRVQALSEAGVLVGLHAVEGLSYRHVVPNLRPLELEETDEDAESAEEKAEDEADEVYLDAAAKMFGSSSSVLARIEAKAARIRDALSVPIG